jgi:hypothetical protein
MEDILCCKCDTKCDGDYSIIDTDAYGDPVTYRVCKACYEYEIERDKWVSKMMQLKGKV